MDVELVSITTDAEAVIESAARTCYQSESGNDAQGGSGLIQKLIKMGHESPLEHAYATFRISGCSRAMTHQLVRHRLMAVSQKSQRYVSEKGFEYVVPASMPEQYAADFDRDMDTIRDMYRKWKERGLKNEDARFVLPNACATEIVISANFREFRHIFRIRCDRHAQWEIREACIRMRDILYEQAPQVFEDLTQTGN